MSRAPLFRSARPASSRSSPPRCRSSAARRAVQAQRGGVALDGGAPEVRLLNPRKPLLRSACWSRSPEGAYRDENDLHALARSVDWSIWIDPAPDPARGHDGPAARRWQVA